MKRMTITLRTSLVLVIIALLTSLGFWISFITPAEEATRLRNSLIFTIGNSADFDWAGNNFPAQFKLESQPVPTYFQSFVDELAVTQQMSEFAKMKVAIEKLLERERYGGAIQSDTVSALKKMREEGVGYCSDYTQVVNGLAHTMNIPVREWGMSFDGYSGYGHAFSEIYDSTLNKWVFIDSHSGFYALEPGTGLPFSFLEFRSQVMNHPGQIEVVKFHPERFGFKDDRQVIDYYIRGSAQVFLYLSNDVFSYDSHPVIQLTGAVSRYLEQLSAIVFGIHPKIMLYPDPRNEEAQHRLQQLSSNVKTLFIIDLVLVGLFLLIIFKMLKNRRKQHAKTV